MRKAKIYAKPDAKTSCPNLRAWFLVTCAVNIPCILYILLGRVELDLMFFNAI
jgi:hypothetical protein